MKLQRIANILITLLMLISTNFAISKDAVPVSERIELSEFGVLDDGRTVTRYLIKNRVGASVEIINYGAIITAINVPDRNGKLSNVALGYDNIEQYIAGDALFGAVVGRYANRIGGASFTLEGTVYTLKKNNRDSNIHGGPDGFYKRIWAARSISNKNGAGIELTLTSPDGDQGFPGNLEARVEYVFDDENRLSVTYGATTDKPTIVNMTQHSYFNLAGHGSGSIESHVMQANAKFYLQMDLDKVSNGEILSVANTPLDFRNAKTIGRDIDSDHFTTKSQNGYGRYLVIDQSDVGHDSLFTAAVLTDPASGRVMTVRTSEPGFQFYSGNGLSTQKGSDGATYRHRAGVCFETHGFPNAPNIPHFPQNRLDPGEEYFSRTVFEFSALP